MNASVLALLAGALGLGAGACRPLPAPEAPPALAPRTARVVSDLLATLAQHPLVLFGEVHGEAECHEVLQALLRDARLPALVDDLVVEFGNPLYQDVVDRYVSGEDVPLEELRHAWRDTAIPLTWDAPMYAAFFRTVRERNASLEPDERMRIVLGECPIDWSRVRTAEDYGAFADRSGDYARTVEREVLARGRRALLVIGAMHVLRRDPRNAFADELPRYPGLGQLLATEHPGTSFAIWPIHGELPPDALAGESPWTAPALVPLAGRPLGAATFGPVAPRNVRIQREVEGRLTWVPLRSDDWPPMEVLADALLDLGPTSTIVPAPDALYRDEAYVEELRRRCGLLDAFYGFDFYGSDLEERLAGLAVRPR